VGAATVGSVLFESCQTSNLLVGFVCADETSTDASMLLSGDQVTVET
jgi:hypothetical protein